MRALRLIEWRIGVQVGGAFASVSVPHGKPGIRTSFFQVEGYRFSWHRLGRLAVTEHGQGEFESLRPRPDRTGRDDQPRLAQQGGIARNGDWRNVDGWLIQVLKHGIAHRIWSGIQARRRAGLASLCSFLERARPAKRCLAPGRIHRRGSRRRASQRKHPTIIRQDDVSVSRHKPYRASRRMWRYRFGRDWAPTARSVRRRPTNRMHAPRAHRTGSRGRSRGMSRGSYPRIV